MKSKFYIWWRHKRVKYFQKKYQAKKEHQALVSHFDYLFKYANDIIFFADKDLNIIEANDRSLEAYGWTRNELIGLHVSRLCAPQAVAQLPVQMRTLDEMKTATYETIHQRKDGSTFPVELSAREIEIDGKIIYQTIGRDITERKRVEEALIKSEANFRILFEHSPVGKSMTGIDGSLQVNKSFCNILGYSEQELRTKKWNDITYPDDIQHNTGVVQSLLDGKISQARFEKRYIHKDGTVLWMDVSTYLQRDKDGKPQFFITTIYDVTERKHAEEALRTNEVRLLNAQAIAHVGDWEIDLKTRMMWGSLEAKRIYGLEPIEGYMPIEMIQKCVLPEYRSKMDAALQRLLALEGDYSEEFQIRRVIDGEKRYIHSIGKLDVAPHGKPEKVVGVLQDITERKRAEEKIRQLNEDLERRVLDRTAQLEVANKELESFAYSVSHDLRAPLRGIDGWSLALQEDFQENLNDQARQDLDRIRSETQRMGQLIDDLLKLSRVTRTEMEPMSADLTKIAHSILSRMQTRNTLRKIDFIIQPGLSAWGDNNLLDIMLTNLFDNAAKFTGSRESARIEFGRTNIDGKPVFFVRDNGIGFDMKYAQNLFGAFQRMHNLAEFPGTGIGLATVQRIIHRHGGRIWADAKVDGGATFYFTLKEEA